MLPYDSNRCTKTCMCYHKHIMFHLHVCFIVVGSDQRNQCKVQSGNHNYHCLNGKMKIRLILAIIDELTSTISNYIVGLPAPIIAEIVCCQSLEHIRLLSDKTFFATCCAKVTKFFRIAPQVAICWCVQLMAIFFGAYDCEIKVKFILSYGPSKTNELISFCLLVGLLINCFTHIPPCQTHQTYCAMLINTWTMLLLLVLIVWSYGEVQRIYGLFH